MKRGLIAAVVLVGLAALVACAGDSRALDGTEWVLISLNGQPPLEGRLPSIKLASGEAGGTTGCNSYFGTYAARGDALSFEGLGMTEMACMDPEGIMDQETAFLAALSEVRSYRLAAGRLEMLDTSGGLLLAWEKPAPLPEPALEGTDWDLESFISGDAVSSVLADTEITVRYDSGKVSGTAGCNDYHGDYSLEGDTLEYGILAINVEACPSPEGIMEQESRYMEIFRKATALRLDANQLTLAAPDGQGLAFTAR